MNISSRSIFRGITSTVLEEQLETFIKEVETHLGEEAQIIISTNTGDYTLTYGPDGIDHSLLLTKLCQLCESKSENYIGVVLRRPCSSSASFSSEIRGYMVDNISWEKISSKDMRQLHNTSSGGTPAGPRPAVDNEILFT